MNTERQIFNIAFKAKQISSKLILLSEYKKNKILLGMIKALKKNVNFILKENKKDVLFARKKRLVSSLIDRLILTPKRFKQMINSLKEIVELKDPVGKISEAWRRPNGLLIAKMRVPIGVITIIYEARPTVTSDCIGLAVKSSNALILKGGSEALNSNRAIFKVMSEEAYSSGLPQGAINFISLKTHKTVEILLKLKDYIDLIIPRGGESLIRKITESSLIPVIKHYKGICHVYVDEYADIKMAKSICLNAKLQRPAVCNAMETLLVHKNIAAKFLPPLVKELKKNGVEIRGCPLTFNLCKDIKLAEEKDWITEYLDLILSVKIVKDIDEAITHINFYGSHHSDSIVTTNYTYALKFLQEVDSACVFVNASTRFSDGYEFGLGAEIGISTDKLHARGPMALEELTTYKYIVFGNGQIRK